MGCRTTGMLSVADVGEWWQFGCRVEGMSLGKRATCPPADSSMFAGVGYVLKEDVFSPSCLLLPTSEPVLPGS